MILSTVTPHVAILTRIGLLRTNLQVQVEEVKKVPDAQSPARADLLI